MNINLFFKSFKHFLSDFKQFYFLQNSSLIEEYLVIFFYLCVAFFISLLIVVLSYFLIIQNPETEKLSSYECGFDSYGDSRARFNIKFYILAILFILFDIEIIFLFPWSISVSQLDLLGFWTIIEFILELIIGFVYVWCIGAID